MERRVSKSGQISKAKSLINCARRRQYELNNTIAKLGALEPLSGYIAENGLSGAAYTNSKHHMEDHITVIFGAIIANGEFASCLDKLSTTVGSERLIEDELKDSIASCEQLINQYEIQRDYYQSVLTNPTYEMTYGWYARRRINSCNKLIGFFNEIKRRINEKIDKLYEINGQVSGIFGSAASIYANVKSGIQSLDSGRDVVGFAPRVAGEWRAELNRCISEYEKNVLKQIEEQAEKDYKDGKISFDLYQSIRDGLRSAGFAFLREVFAKQVTDTTSKALADSIYVWFSNYTTTLVDGGLVCEFATGGEMLAYEAPTAFAQIVRGFTRNAVYIIGTVLDFGIMKTRGESTFDAGVKAVSHTAIAIGGAKLGAVIGTAIGPVGTVSGAAIGAAIGFVIGVGGNIVFDLLYDNKGKIVKGAKKFASDVGNGAKKLASGVGKGAKKLGKCFCNTCGSIGNALFGW